VKQGDLFENDATALRSDDRRWRPDWRPDLEKIRAKLRAVVDEAREASTMPWDWEQLRYHRTVIPQMSRWLPDDEAAQICREFDAELARLSED
jgi:hypothetical protein